MGGGGAQDLLDRPVTLQVEDKPLKTILSLIERKASVNFIYSPKAIQVSRHTSVSVQNRSLQAVLERMLTPLNINFRQAGGRIVLSPLATSSLLLSSSVEPVARVLADQIVTGTVSDETGMGLPGVSVLVKGIGPTSRQRGTTTDAVGKYRLSIPEGTVILVFSYVGYTSQEVAVNNRTILDIRLLTDNKSLNEVVVVGYGTQQRKDLTGSIASVGADEIAKLPVASVDQALQGKIPGLQISTTSGEPGGSPNILIRG